MKRGSGTIWRFMVWLLGVASSMGLADQAIQSPPLQDGVEAHAGIVEYIGPETCLQCHLSEATDVFHSVHYQWTGPTPEVPNIPGNAGKADLGFNTYCGTVVTSRHIACWTCHIGNGADPEPEVSPQQLQNIDCLMCHSESYQRRAVSPLPQADANRDTGVNLLDLARAGAAWGTVECGHANLWCGGADVDFSGKVALDDVMQIAMLWLEPYGLVPFAFTDYLGVQRTWMLPDETEDGSFSFIANEAAMTVTPVQAARAVHRPTRATCLRCHAYAAGSDCGKRGDLSTATINPPYAAEIHMSPDGLDFSCQECHVFENHRVIGRGLDLRPNDRPGELDCTNCHDSRPHDDDRRDSHTARVACATCHIPRYAKNMSTEVARDWNNPQWYPGLFGGQGGYKPEEIRGQDLIPAYLWYDGTSYVYIRGETPPQNAEGQYVFSAPNGAIDSPAAKIHPMKVHLSETARQDETGVMIPHSTFTYFVTGDWQRAVEEGMQQVGMSGPWTTVPVLAYQTINHGVEPEDHALRCGNCHASLADSEDLRMDLQELGYVLKGPQSEVCRQCHGPEEAESFREIHNEHVREEDIDCSWCHTFSRPERNLDLPPAPRIAARD